VVALLVLGPKKLPGLARSLGRSLAEFRRASADIRREFLDVADEARIQPPYKTPPAKPPEPKPPEATPTPEVTPSSDVPRG
jgi:TatA/E family protein of Tat protein translocase